MEVGVNKANSVFCLKRGCILTKRMRTGGFYLERKTFGSTYGIVGFLFLNLLIVRVVESVDSRDTDTGLGFPPKAIHRMGVFREEC
jgi:hypothetical protein